MLYITLSETARGAARLSPSRMAGPSTASHIRELTPSEADLSPDEQNTMFHPSDVELAETTQRILATSRS